MALLRHLLCGLVVFCLTIDVNAEPDPDEFRCPADMGDGYCTLKQVVQPHDTDSNARILYPLTIKKHCVRTNKESNADGGIWFTSDTCKMLRYYPTYQKLSKSHQKNQGASHGNLFDKLQCKVDGWQTGDNCRLKQQDGTYEHTKLYKGQTRDIWRDLQDVAAEKINRTLSQSVIANGKMAYAKAEELKKGLENRMSGEPKEDVVVDAPTTVVQAITEINTKPGYL